MRQRKTLVLEDWTEDVNALKNNAEQYGCYGFYHLTNRRQFSMVYTLIDHEMTSKNVQNSSGTTSRRRVVSLPSFGHFMASFYGG